MLLTTVGRPKKVPLSICKDAVRWYGQKLLGPRLFNNVEILLEFDDSDLGNEVYGFCDWNDDNHRARDFTITVDPNLGKRNTLIVLAHEMVHVKQYAKGEMKDYLRAKRVKWRGKVYDDNQMSYWDYPWEIEAHGREKGLYYRFINSMKE